MAGKKKDFSEMQMNLGRVYGTMEQATAAHRGQSVITPEEKAERLSNMRTQGRKGAKLPRINCAFSVENYDYLTTTARACGLTLTAAVNKIIEQHRNDHPEAYEKAKQMRAEMEL